MTKNPTLSHIKQHLKPTIRAYLGGSFNPVHNAHIEMAMQVYDSLAPITAEQQCQLQVSLLPNARSPFKLKSTAPKHRLAMLELAIQNTPLQIDELELWQQPPVYTIDSVHTLRQRYPQDILIFIMGMDSARSLEQWKQGLDLTNYVNLWIFNRDDNDAKNTTSNLSHAELIKQLPLLLQNQVTDSVVDLLLMPEPATYSKHTQFSSERPSFELPLKSPFKGRIYIDIRELATVSSTEIRSQLFKQAIQASNQANNPINLATESNPLLKYLNPAVYHYIMQHKLYSTA